MLLDFWNFGERDLTQSTRRTTFSSSGVHGPISISGNAFVCEEHGGENEGRTNAFSHKTYCR